MCMAVIRWPGAVVGSAVLVRVLSYRAAQIETADVDFDFAELCVQCHLCDTMVSLEHVTAGSTAAAISQLQDLWAIHRADFDVAFTCTNPARPGTVCQ